MAKHRRQTTTVTRRIATTAVAAASATVAVPAVANATEVVIPNTNYSFDVQGLDQIPNIDKVPNIQTYVPSLRHTPHVDYSAPAPAAPAPVAPAAPAPLKSEGQKIVEAARSVLGAPYGWGAAGPSSFDCSGLTSWAYGQLGKSIPRTSQAQAAQGTPVSLDQLQPGDIVAYYAGASHVGIYTGNGTIIDALNSGTPVQERPLDYMPLHSAFRF